MMIGMDDDVHNSEMRKAKELAGARRVPVGDVLRAFDDGMREGWPTRDGSRLIPEVTPCRPRPIY